MERLKATWERLQQLRPFVVWKRYGDANGDLLAAGIGYFAFFSLFPAIALGYAIFGFFLRGHPELLGQIAQGLNENLPGFVKTPQSPQGVISLDAPPGVGTLTITGVLAFITLLLAGMGWIGALRTGIRAIYGAEGSPGNVVTDKLRDLGVLVGLGLGIAISSVLSSVLGGLAETIASWVHLEGQQWLVTLAGLFVGFVFDTILMVLLLRVLSGVSLPWREVGQGAALGGLLLTLMKFFAGFLVGQATKSPLLGSIAVVVGLLFWLNLMSKVTLLSAAWAANDADLAQQKSPGATPAVDSDAS